ncbi:hypothetical protein P4H65_24205 [Paenibacillus chitinolyticus]|nr:hypothetical protein [Paenibacillus chitinolyticus]MEC0248900.1 hypothetical protein [Paenibacillus chitinolyticus]
MELKEVTVKINLDTSELERALKIAQEIGEELKRAGIIVQTEKNEEG